MILLIIFCFTNNSYFNYIIKSGNKEVITILNVNDTIKK